MSYEGSPSLAWLKQGQTLEAGGHLAEAITAYEKAVRAAPDARERGLAQMNRGNALQKLAADPRADDAQRNEAIGSAVHAYDEAIALFRTLPCDTEPALRNHLGAAWLNRGHALLATDDVPAVVDSFRHAVAELEQLPVNENPNYRLNLAGAWTNLAHALLGAPAEARVAAQSALALVVDVERAHPLFAEMSLRARRALVTAIGALLVTTAAPAALASEASDAIDDGLDLARECEQRGAAHLRPLAARLFRMGTQLYRVHQPHFLAEFVLENIAPNAFAADAEFRAAAAEALDLALADLRRPQLFIAGTPEADRSLTTLRELRAAREQLSALGI